MARSKTQGWYLFADGYYCWFNGMSGTEKKFQIKLHGAIVKFTPTN